MAVDAVLAGARQGNIQGLPWWVSEHEISHTFRAVDAFQPIPTYLDRNTSGVSGVFNPNDGLPNCRLTAPIGGAPASQAYRYNGTLRPIFNRQDESPVGIYYRAFAKIVDSGRANIEFALVGFGIDDGFNNGFNARVRPVIGFYATGAGTWQCRVEDGAGIVESSDTGVDPTDPHLLEIVIQPGSTRFYIDGTLRFTSTVIYPADTVTNAQMLRYNGAHIKGNGVTEVYLDIVMERFHYYWLASTTDEVLSEARLNIFRPNDVKAGFWLGANLGENPWRGDPYRFRGRFVNESWSKVNSTEFGFGCFADGDKLWVGRCAAPTAQGDANDAAAYMAWTEDPYWSLYNRFEASALGWYFGALVRVEDLNRSAISLGFAGWGLRGNKATDKVPLVAFFVEGASNWKCRVQDDASSGAVTDDFITSIDPTEPHYLEIVIIAGEVRFFIDGVGVFTSTVEFPPDSAAKTASWEREALFYIDGDNVDPTAMRFGLVNVHVFERITPVEY